MNQTQSLRVEEFRVLEGKVEKLNKRADKLGVGHVLLVNVERYDKEVSTGSTLYEKAVEKWVRFSIDGQKPSINGYKVIASLESVNGRNLIKYLMDERESGHDLSQYINSVTCDHCNANRKRKYTYILQEEETGKYIQVGKTCLKDFLSYDIQYIVAYSKINIDEIQKEVLESGLVGDVRGVDIIPFLSVVIESVNDIGYNNAYTHYSTGERVWDIFYPRHKSHRDYDISECMEKNTEEAERILKWGRGLGERDNDNYFSNLYTVACSDVVEYSRKGLVSSMVIAYRRELAGEVTKKEKKEQKEVKKPKIEVSKYVGNVGDKIEVEIVVTKIMSFEGRFGVTYFIQMKDDEGNTYNWYTGSKHKMEENKRYSIKGKVKAHTLYRGAEQTTLFYVTAEQV